MSCGKVICAREGLGPCMFCGVDYKGATPQTPTWMGEIFCGMGDLSILGPLATPVYCEADDR
eukprot:4263098-Pyramimonas_sp.AAC.1